MPKVTDVSARRRLREQTRERFTELTALREQEERGESGIAEYERLREELINGHINLVRFLAGKFANRGEPLEDLVQIGVLALIKAVDRFDVTRNVDFTTYATPTILGEIKRHFRDKGWAMRVPRRFQDLNIAITRAIDRLSIELERVPSVADIALDLGVMEEEVLEAQEFGQVYHLRSIDSELSPGEGPSNTLQDVCGAADSGFEIIDDRLSIDRAISSLTKREQLVLRLHFYHNMRQSDIARRIGISQMQVSRIQTKALFKLRVALRAEPVGVPR